MRSRRHRKNRTIELTTMFIGNGNVIFLSLLSRNYNKNNNNNNKNNNNNNKNNNNNNNINNNNNNLQILRIKIQRKMYSIA